MAWYKVAETTDLSKPFIKKVSAGRKVVCLVYDSAEVFALSAICPHAGADLSQGWCQQGKLICPYHRYSYDLQTGRGSPGQNDYVNTYPVSVKTDGVYVEVKSWIENVKDMF